MTEHTTQKGDEMIPKGQETAELGLAAFGFMQLNDVVLLTLISKGIDNRADLARASLITKRTVYRRLEILTGANKYVPGKGFSAGHVQLVTYRPHPHQQGQQMVLTDAGTLLLQEIYALIA